MKQLMADIDLPASLQEEFISLIPKQRQTINELMGERVIGTYPLALDRSKLLDIIFAESQKKTLISFDFPLAKFMDVRIHELAFYKNVSFHTPHFSLN
jgi:hypothetical protein